MRFSGSSYISYQHGCRCNSEVYGWNATSYRCRVEQAKVGPAKVAETGDHGLLSEGDARLSWNIFVNKCRSYLARERRYCQLFPISGAVQPLPYQPDNTFRPHSDISVSLQTPKFMSFRHFYPVSTIQRRIFLVAIATSHHH